MRRREFVAGVGGVAGSAVVPLAAQPPAMPVVGILNPPDMNAAGMVAFRKGLSETGYVEGQNVAIEFHWAAPRYPTAFDLIIYAAVHARMRVMTLYCAVRGWG
jgi:putative ABC transport system substrate-binding protein